MKKTLRLIALLLVLSLALQAAVFAADPPEAPEDASTVLPDPGTTPDPVDPPADPAQPETPEPGEAPDPGETPAEPVPIVITSSLEDGLVVHSPVQVLRVTALQGETALEPDQLQVSLNGAVLAPAGEYALRLDPGENTLAIAAATDTAEAALTLKLVFDFEIPEGWAHDALAFCVKYGVLNGDQNGDLMPTRSATRAQLAAVLVRLFDAKPAASLSGYTDVPETAWYHNEMARAVAMGIFEGSNGKLNPDSPITREQAFTVLARAFGVAAATLEALRPFPDAGLVSIWAKSSVAGMLEADYVHGNTSGNLNPKGNITRQELAQVLYNALDCITDDPDALTGTRCLYTGPAGALEGRRYDGDLIVSSQDKGELTLENLDVTGRLVLHLPEAERAVIGTGAEPVSLCSATNLTLTNPAKTVNCQHEGAELTADADLAVVDGAATLHGSYGKVVCLSGDSVIAQDAAAGELDAACNITVNGAVEELHARNKCAAIKGSGSIGTLYKYKNGLSVEPSVGKTVDRIDAGLEGVAITSGPAPDVYMDSPAATVTGTVSGVNSTQVYGVPGGVRTCTVTYRYGGADTELPQSRGAGGLRHHHLSESKLHGTAQAAHHGQQNPAGPGQGNPHLLCQRHGPALHQRLCLQLPVRLCDLRLRRRYRALFQIRRLRRADRNRERQARMGRRFGAACRLADVPQRRRVLLQGGKGSLRQSAARLLQLHELSGLGQSLFHHRKYFPGEQGQLEAHQVR